MYFFAFWNYKCDWLTVLFFVIVLLIGTVFFRQITHVYMICLWRVLRVKLARLSCSFCRFVFYFRCSEGFGLLFIVFLHSVVFYDCPWSLFLTNLWRHILVIFGFGWQICVFVLLPGASPAFGLIQPRNYFQYFVDLRKKCIFHHFYICFMCIFVFYV